MRKVDHVRRRSAYRVVVPLSYPAAMVRHVEVELHHRGQAIGTRLEEVRPPRCEASHSLRWTGRQACPSCGLNVVQYWCGRGCEVVVDPDHVHGDPTEWATVVRLDGSEERIVR